MFKIYLKNLFDQNKVDFISIFFGGKPGLTIMTCDLSLVLGQLLC
jgi:hypothetical protein